MFSDTCTEQSVFRTITSGMYSFIVVTGVFFIGTGLGVIVTSLMIRRPEIDESDIPDILYEDKYFDEYFELTVRDGDVPAAFDGKSVTDDTPQGVVTMEYSAETNTFVWYAATGITDKNLNTVARKFVIAHDCASLYYNVFDYIDAENVRYNEEMDLYKSAKELAPPNAELRLSPTQDYVVVESAVEDVVPGPKSVFASLKNYRADSTKTSDDIEMDRISREHRGRLETIHSKVNRFKKGGSLVDYDELVKSRTAESVPPRRGMSFAFFKRNTAV
jgi:hypothetical protein